MSLRRTINNIEGEVTVDPTTKLPRQLSPKECLNMLYETLESPNYQFEPINAKDFGFVMDRNRELGSKRGEGHQKRVTFSGSSLECRSIH